MRSIQPRLLLLTLLLALPLAAQVASDSVLKDFKANGDFILEIDGQDLKNAEIYFSERAVAYLLMAPELSSPLMVSLRSQAVESLHLMKVYKKKDGTVDLLADAVLQRASGLQLASGRVLVFTVAGKLAKLKPNPPLLGRHQGERLKRHNPEYAFRAGQYSPQSGPLEELRNQPKKVKVMVYFGSWCPACKRMVPNVLRVADEIEGSQVEFVYYGLPQPLTADPESERADIHGVPTVVIFVDGEEAGRLDGHDLNAPEASLVRLLAKS